MASAYFQILDQVKVQLDALALTGVTSTNIVVMKRGTIRKKEIAGLPAVIVTPIEQPRVITGTSADTIGRDVIQYPVGVMCLQASNQNQTSNFDRIALWVENIFKEFHHRAMSAVTAGNVYTCVVANRDIVHPDAWGDGYDAGALTLRFNTQLVRT